MIKEKINEINQIGSKMIGDQLQHNFAGLITNNKYLEKYDCTPLNTVLFACTGGDGVHFSYLPIDEKINPIVMTVPSIWGESIEVFNLILAEDLEEFLNLGYFKGWFGLEGYLYNYSKNETLMDYNLHQKYYFGNENEGIFLEKLISHFKLKPLSLDEERLNYLKEKYFEKLEFNQEFIEKLGLN